MFRETEGHGATEGGQGESQGRVLLGRSLGRKEEQERKEKNSKSRQRRKEKSFSVRWGPQRAGQVTRTVHGCAVLEATLERWKRT